jgi:2-succinyl-6-hydroxy-2,4-cyclohexadiene-1-carboxylate synthase
MRNPIWLLSGFLGNENHWSESKDLIEQNIGVPVEWINWAELCRGSKSLSEAALTLAQLAIQTGQRPVLVGYSMGGRLALQAICEAPGSFEKIIAISSHTGLTTEALKSERLQKDLEWSELLKTDFEQFWQKWNEQDVLKTHKLIERPNVDLNLWSEHLKNLSTGKQEDLTTRLNDPRLPPILVMAGAEDEKYSKLIEALPESIEKKIIGHSGHRIPIDNPKDMAEAIGVFIRKKVEFL